MSFGLDFGHYFSKMSVFIQMTVKNDSYAYTDVFKF